MAANSTYVCVESVLDVILHCVLSIMQAALPKGIYTLQPNLYHGYLTYTKKGVTGRGTKPKEGTVFYCTGIYVTGKKCYRVYFR